MIFYADSYFKLDILRRSDRSTLGGLSGLKFREIATPATLAPPTIAPPAADAPPTIALPAAE